MALNVFLFHYRKWFVVYVKVARFLPLETVVFFQVTLGQRRGISAIDARQMNLLYKSKCRSGGGDGGGGEFSNTPYFS